MKCEILTSFSGVMGSFSVGVAADDPDEHVAELASLGWVQPLGKAPTRKAAKEQDETTAGEGDEWKAAQARVRARLTLKSEHPSTSDTLYEDE